MQQFYDAFGAALRLILTFDPDLVQIVRLSLTISLTAVALAALIGLPLGAAVALYRFPGRRPLTVLLSSLMGLPPVVVGLVVYLALSRAGPLGVLGLLFTPTAMILAQTLLVMPIVAALARQFIEDLWQEYAETGSGMGATLDTAVAMGAYALTDRGTWISFQNKGDFTVLVEGDRGLFNQYGVILVNPQRYPSVKAKDGQAFIDWLISPAGQSRIAQFRIDGQQLFFPNYKPGS